MHKNSIISFSLCIMLLASTFPVVTMATSDVHETFDKQNEEIILFQIEENMKYIEEYLVANGTSVEDEMLKFIALLQLKLSTANKGNQDKFRDLINVSQSLLDDYSNYKNDVITRGGYHPVLSPAVAAIVTFFSASGYYLSAELLVHAKDNNILDSTYYPGFGSNVLYSSVTTSIRSSNATSGSNAYPNSGSTVEKDLYYAIHRFSWEKNYNNQITIKDRYDYDVTQNYAGIQGVATDTMYLAQTLGVIVPFQVRIIV